MKARETSAPVSLHQLWDGLVVGSDRYRDTANAATELRLRPEFAPERLGELKAEAFEAWAKDEGVSLARDVVYRDGKLAGGAAREAAAVLPGDYFAGSKPVAERRVVLAGHRLADVLVKLVR